MSAIDWFTIFAALFVIMAVLSGWMMWFSRRAMRSYKTKIDEMILEMRQTIDENARRPGNTDDGTKE